MQLQHNILNYLLCLQSLITNVLITVSVRGEKNPRVMKPIHNRRQIFTLPQIKAIKKPQMDAI